jgi:hypothetical protein
MAVFLSTRTCHPFVEYLILKIINCCFYIGIRSVDNLKGQSAEHLYDRLRKSKATLVYKCMLYVLRYSVI